VTKPMFARNIQPYRYRSTRWRWLWHWWGGYSALLISLFHEKRPLLFFHNSLKWWSNDDQFLPVV